MQQAISIGYIAKTTSLDGVVHSAFDRAVNVINAASGQMYGLISAHHPDSPTAIRLHTENAAPNWGLRFGVGENVFLRNGILRVHNAPDAAIELRQAQVWAAPENLYAATDLDIRTRLGAIHAQLTLDQIGLAPADIEAAADPTQNLLNLVGLGVGLTPAGDDFLVGYLCMAAGFATRHLAASTETTRLMQALRPALSGTTHISAHHLTLALDGHFNAHLCRLRTLLLGASENQHALTETAQALSAIGASSGRDTLAGVSAAVRRFSPLSTQPSN